MCVELYTYIYIIYIYEPEKNPGCIRYILGGGTALAPFNFLKRPATKYDV